LDLLQLSQKAKALFILIVLGFVLLSPDHHVQKACPQKASPKSTKSEVLWKSFKSIDKIKQETYKQCFLTLWKLPCHVKLLALLMSQYVCWLNRSFPDLYVKRHVCHILEDVLTCCDPSKAKGSQL